MNKYMMLFVLVSGWLQAVIIENNLDEAIYIHDVTFDDKRDQAMLPFRLKAHEACIRPGFESLSITTENTKKTRRYTQLDDATRIPVSSSHFSTTQK